MKAPLRKAILSVAAIVVLPIPGQARITRLVVERTETLRQDGYEKLTGPAYGELNPKLALNGIITDLEFAPRNARGMVEYAGTFTIVKPADMTKASGVLLYFVLNRGRINLNAVGFPADARQQGHMLAASGWQGDIQPSEGIESLSVPVARNLDGAIITGRVLSRFNDMPADATTLPILHGGVARTADPVSLDTARATLTRRASQRFKVVPLGSADWAFADCGQIPFPGKPESFASRTGSIPPTFTSWCTPPKIRKFTASASPRRAISTRTSAMASRMIQALRTRCRGESPRL